MHIVGSHRNCVSVLQIHNGKAYKDFWLDNLVANDPNFICAGGGQVWAFCHFVFVIVPLTNWKLFDSKQWVECCISLIV